MEQSTSRAWHGSVVLAAGSMLDHPAHTLVTAAADAGFDAVGLRSTGIHAVDDPARLREMLAEVGLFVHDTEVHRIGTDTDPTPLIEATVAVGAERLLVVSDLADRSATVEALGDLTARCRDSGLRVGLEYMAWTTPSTPSAAIEIALATGCELLVDVLHHHRVGAGADEFDAIVASGTLGWVQLCDAVGAPPSDHGVLGLEHEARHERLPPGTGLLPLADLLARIPADVAVSIEVQSDDLLTMAPNERARLLHDTARRVLAGQGVGQDAGTHRPSSTG